MPSCARSTLKPAVIRYAVRSSVDRRSSSMTSTVVPRVMSTELPASVGTFADGRPGSRSRTCSRRRPRSVEPHLAAHQRDDAPTQRQTEAGALLRRRAPRPCWKDSKIRSWSSGATPMPVSVTVTTTVGRSRLGAAPRRGPIRRELHRVAQQVEHHLLEPQLVGVDDAEARVHLERDREADAARPARAPSTIA